MTLRSNYPNQLTSDALAVLNMVIFDNYAGVPDYIDQIFNVMPLGTFGEHTLTEAGIKAAGVKAEGSPYENDSSIEGYSKFFSAVTYGISTSFSQELVEDDRMQTVKDTVGSLGLSMAQTRQVVAMNVLNDAFTDTGPDGVSLANTAHPMIGGHTYANRPAVDVALSVSGIREMDTDFMRQVNHRNINVAAMAQTVVVPPELKHVAKELFGSPDKPNTAERAINTIAAENYTLIVSPFLTSTTAWYVLASKAIHKLRYYNRVSPESKTWQDDKTGDVNTNIRCRFAVGYADFIGFWATTGA